MTRDHSALALALAAAALAACSPRRVTEPPILQNGAKVEAPVAAVASGACADTVCAALARGEIALGMSETQVLAATRTTPDAWTARRTGGASVLVARDAANPPSDAVGNVAMVQLADGRVSSYSYRES